MPALPLDACIESTVESVTVTNPPEPLETVDSVPVPEEIESPEFAVMTPTIEFCTVTDPAVPEVYVP